MYPQSRALGWPGASRPGKGQLSTRCQSTPPRTSTFGTVGIRPVSLDAGSRALRQYSRAPRQKTVSRPRALDGARRRSAIYVLDRPTRRRDTRSCSQPPLLSLSLSWVCRVIAASTSLDTVVHRMDDSRVRTRKDYGIIFNSRIHVGPCFPYWNFLEIFV